jgi:transcriptional regulator with XRE-family HTH domain
MARPAKPKTDIAKRLIEFRGGISRDDFAQSVEVIPGTYANYERGDSEPNSVVLQKLASVHGMNIHWLMTGTGSMRVGEGVKVDDTNMAHVRKVVQNIAYFTAGQGLRRMKPDAYSEHFLELFDYLMTLDDYDEKSAEKVIEFGSERLKRAFGQAD